MKSKQSNEPVMDGIKTCIRCGEVKHVTAFHAHKQMKDGRLNKCAPCVTSVVAEWREKNPDARKNEHHRNAQRKGIKPRSEWLREIADNAIGRKASSLKYQQKRTAQKRGMPVWLSELDELAFEEAKRLAEQRTAITGAAWSIDHIVPINHKKATGLHNGFNLNVAPASWNSSKGNRHMQRYFGV
jgi:hypothetical protein